MINIAGQRIPLTVAFDQQNLVRETEKNVSDLYEKWSRMFPRRTIPELLAMIAYQYASFYITLSRRYDDALKEAINIDRRLGEICGDDSAE